MDVYLDDGPYDEEWRILPEYNNYVVSNYGRVYNADTESLLKGWATSSGALRVKISGGGKQKDYYVHLLVAYLYLEDYQEGMHVRHLDGDKRNNHVSNLECLGAFRGKGPWYEPDYGGGRLVRIVETGEIFANAMAAAMELQTDYSTIYKCLRGERRKHLGYTFEYV